MNFPLIILVIFLLANLGLGLAKGRGVKTVADYALGDKRFSARSLTMTLLATTIGAYHIFGLSKNLASIGIIALVGFTFHCISYILIGFLFTNQLSRFSSCVSFGDFIGELYGGTAKCFSGFFTGIFCVFYVAFQIQVLGFIFSDFFGLEPLFSIIFSSIVISAYTAFGGMRSVVATDILQFILISCVFITLVFFTLFHVNNFNDFSRLPMKLFSTEGLTFKYFASRISLLFFLLTLVEVPEFQRLLMAKNRVVAKKMYINTAISKFISGIMIVIIVFSAIVIFDDKLDFKNPINYIVKHLVPIQFIPFIGLGLVSVIFSTGDSYLHSAGLCLSKDFLEPVIKREVKLIEVRVITFLSGILAMVIVLWFNGLIEFISHDYFVGPILAAPVLFGLLGLKSSQRMFWYSAVFGFLVTLLASYIPSIQVFRDFIGCFASLFVYFAVHIRENQGFKFIGNPIFPHAEKREFRLKIPTKENFLIRLRETYITHNKLYSTFGIVFGLTIFLRYILFSHYKSPYAEHCFTFAVPALIMCLLVIPTTMYFVWLQFLMPVFWYIVLTYCMPFWITLNLILYGCDFWFINFALICIFSVLVVIDKWKSALFIVIIGVTAAILVSKSIINDYSNSVVKISSLRTVI